VQKKLLLRIVVVALLIIILLIPLGMIQGVVSERQILQHQVDATVASSFAGTQRLTGPLLVIAYIEREILTVTDDKGKQSQQAIDHSRQVFVPPEELTYEGSADVEEKYKGIYKTLVYQAKGVWKARFVVPANLGLAASPSMLTPGNAFLAFGLSDVRGLSRSPKIIWSGREISAVSGTNFEALGDGLHADIGTLDIREAQRYEVTANIDMGGTRSLAFVPIGNSTIVQLRAGWPHPSFGGRFLPQTKQIDEKSFSARWEISHLASKNGDLLRRGLKNTDSQSLEAFDVSFVEPVNIYQQAERAVKYGILFVALTFAAFFLFETLKDLRIHPLQYGLVGLALAVFFLLLVSLSEHTSFFNAYVAASTACVLLIGYYLSHVLGGWRHGAAFATQLAMLYAILYGLLLSEDNALMLGSLLLFFVLAAIMILTRRINWYQLGSDRIAV